MVVVGLGKTSAGVCNNENWDIGKENIRAAVSGNVQSLCANVIVLQVDVGKVAFNCFVNHILFRLESFPFLTGHPQSSFEFYTFYNHFILLKVSFLPLYSLLNRAPVVLAIWNKTLANCRLTLFFLISL